MSIEQTIIDLMPEIAEWNRRNFPDSGALHKAMGIVEETGELFHALLKGAQGIRHTPEEIKAMISDAMADIGVYAIACMANAAEKCAVEYSTRGLIETMSCGLDGPYVRPGDVLPAAWRESETPLPLEAACHLAMRYLPRMVGEIAFSALDDHGCFGDEDAFQWSVIEDCGRLLGVLNRLASDCFGLDYPTILRETWSRVVAKRDWRADPMGAGDVK